MAELTLTAFTSIDGVMQAPGGPEEDREGGFPHGGWVFPHADADMGAIMVDIFNKADAFLLGRRTYDVFAGHWPRVTDEHDPVASRLNRLPKHVASHTRTSFEWNNSHGISNVASQVAALKREYAGEIQVHGSIGLVQTLLQHDLVDEYRVLTFPVVLGQGKRLFGPGAMPATMRLQQVKATSAGVVYSVYRRAGPLQTGSFALD